MHVRRTSTLLLLDIFEQTVTNPLRTFGTMPYHDEEYPDQPLWQSVLLFCCKGMIEGIMVILFFWLLVQVLFTKQLEVHLQILLLVGLTVFCLTLILGCIICCTKSQICSGEDKASVTSAQAPVEPVTPAQNRLSTGTTTASRQLYVELEGDPSEYPSTFTSPAPSQEEFLPGLFSDRAQPACEENQQATSCFSPRRFSSPLQTAPLYKPMHPSRASLPSLPKLGLLTKTCKALQKRSSATEDNRPYNEHSRLNRHRMSSAFMPENSIPLVPLNYGSNAVSKQLFSSKPCLHFTMAFSADQQTLAVTVLNLTGMPQGLEGLTVLGSLPPLHTSPTPAAFRSGLGHKSEGLVLFLNVSSEEELQTCELRLAVNEQRTHRAEGSTLGEVEVKCGGRDWRPEHPVHLVKELTHKNLTAEQGSVSRW
ncbi:uncharacterized protein syt18b [Austrofundulus limnaeus]|uniref:Uncharacterized protein syt18b n=1 Tax=Austrofundulus limnaeus TaxID=52670 RepID=A0A2I4CAE0_AUSLI|nr:PREDICTED: uncharacterized protein LOC106526811 [Austrofundulus limnaeus]